MFVFTAGLCQSSPQVGARKDRRYDERAKLNGDLQLASEKDRTSHYYQSFRWFARWCGKYDPSGQLFHAVLDACLGMMSFLDEFLFLL